MAAITVRECVDLSDHLVMEPDGNFVDLKSFILNPESYVSQHRAHPLVDFGERASEINSVTCSIFSCPFPGFAEHSSVKFTDVYFIQGVSLFHHSRTKSPGLGLQPTRPKKRRSYNWEVSSAAFASALRVST